jgi:hypothetical protein
MDHLIRVTHGIWREVDQVNTLAGRCSALLRGCPDGTVVAGRAAAWLHGLWLPHTDDQRVELILRRDAVDPIAHAGSRRAEIIARRRVLRPDEVVVVDGLPITSEARTWLDLSERLRLPDLIAAGDSALRGKTTPGELEIMISRARHRRGVVRARAALPLLDARSRSRPESHLRYALVSAGLPAPDVNKAIYTDAGEWLAEPDLSYGDARLALEYNGAVHADQARMRRDLTRDIDIQFRGGWRTATFGPDHVFKRPDQTALFVRQLRRERLAVIARRRARPR